MEAVSAHVKVSGRVCSPVNWGGRVWLGWEANGLLWPWEGGVSGRGLKPIVEGGGLHRGPGVSRLGSEDRRLFPG